MAERFHYEYKIITEASYPSTEELNKFISGRRYSWWTDQFAYDYILPTTKSLVADAHARLQESITTHLNDGWRLQGSIFITLKETKIYRHTSGKVNSYDVISYSQALVKEESYEDYRKRNTGELNAVPEQRELEEVKKMVLDIQAKLQAILPSQETS